MDRMYKCEIHRTFGSQSYHRGVYRECNLPFIPKTYITLIFNKKAYGIQSVYYSVDEQKFVMVCPPYFTDEKGCKKIIETHTKSGWNLSDIDSEYIYYNWTKLTP